MADNADTEHHPSELDLIGETRRNWAERGIGEPEAMVAATSLARAHQVVLGRINQALGEFSLTFSRYEALALLSFARNESMGMARMGERLQVHPTSVTNTIDRLETDGLVERRPHPTDGRTTLAALTSGGRALVGEGQAALGTSRFGFGDLDDGALRSIRDDIAPLRSEAGDHTER